MSLPSHTNLVIIGAGIVGSSAAYHLAKLGWRDMLVLDKGDLWENDGSSSHAPGGMHVTNSSKMMMDFAMYSVGLYQALGELEPGNPALRNTGGIEVAHTPERLKDLKRRHGWATSYGVEAHLITPQEAKEHIPILNDKAILGAYYVPSDSNAIGVHVTALLRQGAEQGGHATFIGNTPVADILIEQKRVTGVVTPQGTVTCEKVLLCTNIWGPILGDKIGVTLPLLAAQHQYTVSEPLELLKGTTREIVHPSMRAQDYSLYYRQHGECYGIGNYRHEPLMVRAPDIGKSAIRDFTPEHYRVAWEASTELLPALKDKGLTRKFNGMFAFSVDGYPIMGETPIRGIWCAVASWLTHAGGVGRAIAQWMDTGLPQEDLREADINRFLPHQLTRHYITTRSAQNYREVYDILHPQEQIREPRNVRLSPFHERLKAGGAVFFQSAGYEVAQWYEGNQGLLERYAPHIPKRSGWDAQFWSPIQGAEHLHMREHVGLFNLASLAMIEVRGPGAAAYLDLLAANRIANKTVGQITYSALLDDNAGIYADITIYRTAPETFWVMTGGGLLPHDLYWIKAHAPQDGSVIISDLSASYTPIGLWGPKAAAVLASITDDYQVEEPFPYYSGRTLEVGAIPVTALHMSYVGEYGWELYTPAEYALPLWNALWEAGQAHEMIMVGAGALDSLRLEKGYRLWGAELHTDYNPYEAGIGWAVKLKKAGFKGQEAAKVAKAKPLKRKLCCLILESDAMLMGKEPIMSGDKKVGYVTSANYGYSVGKFIAYGYLPIEYAQEGTVLHIAYFGEPQQALVSTEPLYDRDGNRLKDQKLMAY